MQMTNEQIKETVDSIVGLLPAGRAKEENDINAAALKLLTNLLVNINTIAAAAHSIAASLHEMEKKARG